MADYKRLYNTMQQMVDKYQNEIVPELRKEIEKIAKERDAAIEELSGVLGKVENAADFIDEEIYCDLDYGTYRNLRDVVDDIAIWENEDKWRGVCAENIEAKELEK